MVPDYREAYKKAVIVSMNRLISLKRLSFTEKMLSFVILKTKK